jgi:condensin complex subunit 2
MRKLNQNNYARAGSESPQTPRTQPRPNNKRVISRGAQQNESQGSPGPLNVVGASAVTPMKRVPILANFEEWMKMATDNKINAANSWNFALIDYFHDMSLLKEGDGVNFQKASCTLDGCVKIYTSRVDSVATETGRLLSGLADSADGKGKKNKEAGDDEDGEEGDEDDEDGEGGKKKQKKKPARSHEATLAPSFASLQLKKLELEFAVDPLFKKASADFDEGGAKGLLLNHLSIDSEGRIVFDSSDDAGDASLPSDVTEDQPDQGPEETTAATQPEPQPEEDTDLDLTSLASKFFPDGLTHLDHLDICPSMKTFALGAADLSIPSFLKPPEDWRDQNKTRDSEPPAPLLDPNLNLAEQTGIFLDGSNAFGDDDDFGYDNDEIGGFDINMPENVGFGEGGEAWARNANIEGQLRTVSGELDDNLIDGTDDYAVSLDRRIRGEKEDEEGLLAYFDKAFNSRAKIGSKQFVTLENWRIQKLQKARSSEGPEGTTRKRKEKEPFEIDFTGPMSESLKELLDAPPVADKSISLPKGSRKTKGRNLLDKDDEVVDVRKMMRLWIKPKCRVGRRKNGGYGVVDEGFGARGQTQDEEDADEGRQGDYDANFFADDEQLLPFEGPLPGEDDESDAGGGEENQFMDAREMLSPPPPGVENDEGIIVQGDDGPVIDGEVPQSQEQFGTQEALPGSFGSQLVTQQGRRLRPEYVNYARTAKKVDVRKLKENMWKGMSDKLMKGLTQAFEHDKQQNIDTDMMDIDDPQIQPQPSTPEDTAPPTPTTHDQGTGEETMKFTDLISSLQSIYPQQQMRDISTSYCFICLLHLANEKGLVLQGDRWEGEIEGGKGEMGEIWVRRDEGCGEGYEGE